MALFFSHSKKVALAIVPKFTGFLSICGSSWIIVEVLTEKTKRKTVYNRLLLFMSIMDTMVAVSYMFSTWPIPADSPTMVWAVGNTATCAAQGYFNQLGIVSPIYNVCLALYYILVVKFEVTEIYLKAYAEPFMHFAALSFGFATASVSLKLTLFNNAELWCWIASLPFDCNESFEGGVSNCIRGDNAYIYRWAFFYGPLWFFMFVVVVINGAMYYHVRQGEKAALDQEAAHSLKHGNTTAGEILSGQVTSIHHGNFSSVRKNHPRHRRASTSTPSGVKRPSLFGFDPMSLGTASVVGTHHQSNHGRSHRSSLSMILPERMVEKLKLNIMFRTQSSDMSSDSRQRKNSRDVSATSSDIQYVLAFIEDYPSAAKQYAAAYQFGSRVVLSQCLAYTVAFFLVWTPSSINRIVQHSTGTNYFGLLLFQCFFEPLQGLFNVFVYRYAFYLRMKARNPHLTTRELFRSTWRWTYLGPPPGGRETKSMIKLKSTRLSSQTASTNIPSPSTRSSYPRSNSQLRESGVLDRRLDSKRDSAVDDKVNVLEEESFLVVQEHVNDLMADLMVDYSDNPCVLNQNMQTFQMDFPAFFVHENDVPAPDTYPVQVSPTGSEEFTSVAPMPDFPKIENLEDRPPY